MLQEQNTVFSENNAKLSTSLKELEEQASRFKEIYQKLLAENEKLARIRDGLQEQLDVSYRRRSNFPNKLIKMYTYYYKDINISKLTPRT